MINISKENLKLCLISSKGGHLTQLLQFMNVVQDFDYFFLTFKRPDTKELDPAYYVPKPTNLWKWIKGLFLTLNYFLREKPDVIITTGAGVVVPFCWIGKLLGAKFVFIESFTRIKEPSKGGRLAYPIADLFLVQWKELLEKYGKKAQYRGQVV